MSNRRKAWKKGALIFLGGIALIMVVGLAIGAFYKSEVVELVNDELQEGLHTKASIGDADITIFSDFPNITVLLKDVSIGNDSVSHREFLKARRVHLNLRTYGLLFGEISFRSVRIQDADFFMFRTSTGFSNTDIFKSKDTTDSDGTSKLLFDRQHMILQNCNVAFHDSLRAKFYDVSFRKVYGYLVNDEARLSVTMKGPVDFGGLVFNTAKGAFLHNTSLTIDLRMEYRRDSSILEIFPSRATAQAGRVSLSGNVKLSEPRHMHLRFKTQNVEYEKGIAVLADTLRAKLSKLNVTGPMEVEVDLRSELVPGIPPATDVRFSFPKNKLAGDKLDVRDLSLTGHFTNHANDALPRNSANSVITLSQIKGRIDGLPFQADAKLINPDDLRLEIHAIHSFELEKLNSKVDTSLLKFHGGLFTSEFRYEGKLREYLDLADSKVSGNLDGAMTVTKGSFTLVDRKLKLTDFHTDVHFTEDTLLIRSLGVSCGKSSVNVKGTALNFVPLFVQPEGIGAVRLNITSPYLDMAALAASVKKKQAPSKKQEGNISNQLDAVLSHLQLEVRFKVAEYRSKSFAASGLMGELYLHGKSLNARNVKMNFGGGAVAFNASMKDWRTKTNHVELNAKMTDVEIKDLFTAFDNFGQKTLTADNLYGSVTGEAKINTSVNDFKVVAPTLKGDVSLSVVNGRLVNFAPLEKMSNFLFKKRDFEDVRFAEIKGHFDIANRDVDIKRMEVESSVLTLFVEGRYSLDNRTDLSIQVPLSNLKKRDKTYVPENVGEDAKVGPSIFLRAQSNEKGETTLSYDPFNKRRKRKG